MPMSATEALDYARTNHLRVRLWHGDPKTGKVWDEEYDVCGYIGQSMGPHKIPLLICNSRSTGGGGISPDSVVRIVTTHGGRILYTIPNFDPGTFTSAVVESSPDGLPARVAKNGENIANFKTVAQAERWVAFMKGERFAK